MKRILFFFVIMSIIIFTGLSVVSAQNEMSFYGIGEDLLRVDISLTDYPFILVKHEGTDYFTVTILDKNDKKCVVANGTGEYFGVFFKKPKNFGDVNRVKVTGGGNWKVSFLPDNDRYVKSYNVPILVTGDGPAVFYINGAGSKAEVQIAYPKQTTVLQYNSVRNVKSVLQAQSAGGYPVKIDPEYPLIVIETDTTWSISFPGERNETAQDSVNLSGISYDSIERNQDTDASAQTNPYTQIEDLQKQIEELQGQLDSGEATPDPSKTK